MESSVADGVPDDNCGHGCLTVFPIRDGMCIHMPIYHVSIKCYWKCLQLCFFYFIKHNSAIFFFADQGRTASQWDWRLPSERIWWGCRGQDDQWQNPGELKNKKNVFCPAALQTDESKAI